MGFNRQTRISSRWHFSGILRPKSTSPSAAFTLIDLLVVLAVVAVLLLLQVPAWAGAKALSRRDQCAGNLRQFAMATENYATEHNSILPRNPGGWLWVLTPGDTDALMRYGASRNTFYCPANPDQNVDGLWNLGLPYDRVIGYATSFECTALNRTNVNTSIFPQVGFGGSYTTPDPSKRVLLADVTLSYEGRFTAIPGGYNPPGWPGHRTSHLAGGLPSGGNLAMLDGHVEWTTFSLMAIRSLPNGGPVWWW